MVPTVGLEPTTSRSSDGRSTAELRWHWRPQTDLHRRKAILQTAAFAARPCGPGGSARIRTSVSDFGDRYPAARRPTHIMVDRQRIELCPPGCKPGVPPVNTCDPTRVPRSRFARSRFEHGTCNLERGTWNVERVNYGGATRDRTLRAETLGAKPGRESPPDFSLANRRLAPRPPLHWFQGYGSNAGFRFQRPAAYP